MSIKRLIDFFSRDLRFTLFQNDGERSAPEINKDVFRWLERVNGDPFFLFINYFDAHDPYDQGLEYRHLFTKQKMNDDVLNEMVRTSYFDVEQRYKKREYEQSVRDYLIAMYDTEIYFLDKHIAALISHLKREGLFENTLFIISSDHGEEFFEHGGLMHKLTLYEEVLHVPLLFKFPDLEHQVRLSERVSIVDVFPTVLDFLNIHYPGTLDGRSLLPLIDGTDGAEELRNRKVIAEKYARPKFQQSALRALIGQQYKYLQVNPEQERTSTALYDLQTDPGEQQNLLDKNSAVAERYDEELKEIFSTK